MSPLNVNLSKLITQLDTELAASGDLDKISEAQRRSHTLTDLGDQLVGHFVAKAREAGASWSQIGDAIGVSKQAAQQRWVPPIYSRFTQRARHVVVLAQEQARGHGHQLIDTEHILLGLIGERDGLAAKVLTGLVGSADAVEQAVALRIDQLDREGKNSKDGKKVVRGHLPLTANAKEICEVAAQESVSLLHNYIGTEHLLLGAASVPGGVAFEVLTDLGVTMEVLRPKVLDELAGFAAKRAKGE
ncbi:MAG TPA: Clp protease N-terminal domain-containing protein [Pseudonocardiaceae bacterium]|jgi:hypothetical protein|nr:Clp protease N-terminal domain-containing protein [Pseudonocardiaceae bacterium]